MLNKYGYAIIAVAVAVVAGGAFAFNMVPFGNSGSMTGNVAKQAFELSTGSDLEVLKVEDEGSLKRVTLSDGENVINTYVSADGKYIVQNPLHAENFTQTMEARNDFVTCLEENNARFYGIIADGNEQLQQHSQMAQLQIQVLGGANGLQNLFFGPQSQAFPQEQVLQNGVVWDIDGETVTGLQTIQDLEDATGCTYDAPA